MKKKKIESADARASVEGAQGKRHTTLRFYGDGFVFDTVSGMFYRISPTAGFILRSLDAGVEPGRLPDVVQQHYKIDRAAAVRDIELLRNDLAGIVAVTGLHRGENPQPGPAVTAGLRRRFADLRVVGLSYDPMESGQYTTGIDRIDAAFLVPYPRVGHSELLDRLDEIRRQEPFDVLIPCLDSELPNYIKLAPELAKRGIACMLPTERALAQRGKENLPAFCQRLKVPAPATVASNNPDDLARFVERIGYPAYIKGRFYEAHLVHSPNELYSVFGELLRNWGGPVIAQEITVGEEYDVVGLGDGKGGIEGWCSIRKMLKTKSGKGFAGIVVRDPALDELAAKIIRTLRWHGPFELEFIKAPGRRHQLFEMNPRFPAWVDFPSQIGCNLPARLLERLLGREPTALVPSEPGQMFVRHCVDVVGNIAELAEMASTGHRRGPVPLPSSMESL